jgi:hypothetical protein
VTRAKPSPPPGKKAKPARSAANADRPAPAASKPAGRPALGADPVGAVLAVLAEAGAPLAAGAIKQRLVEAGATAAEADKGWSRAQERIRFHPNVIVDNRTYVHTPQPRTITAAEAVYHLSKGGGTAAQRGEWLAVIEATLAAEATDEVGLAEARSKISAAERRIGDLEAELARLATQAPQQAEPAEQTAHDQYDRAERRRAARERQARIDAMSTVAELAAEVEELTAKRATAEVLLEHTRALTGDRGLEAIGRAGELSPYDAKRHDPVGDVPDEGEPVIVIRPGYLWHAPGEAVLISRAVVSRT